MAFSDARNERDRAETGRNSNNHGGGDARAAAGRNVNAMAANNSPINRGFNPNFNPRRTPNMSPSYEMSLRNMGVLSGMMPGPGMALKAGLGLSGYGPQFEGFTGNVMGPGDYDPRNAMGQRAAMGQGGLGLTKMLGQKPVTPMKPPAQSVPQYRPTMTSAPGLTLQSGLPGYSTFRPGYDFIGQPTAPSRFMRGPR